MSDESDDECECNPSAPEADATVKASVGILVDPDGVQPFLILAIGKDSIQLKLETAQRLAEVTAAGCKLAETMLEQLGTRKHG